MLKLYRREGESFHYHEAWSSGDKIIEHCGNVGETGTTREHRYPADLDSKIAIVAVLAHARECGFEEIEDMQTLVIEYQIDGMGNRADLLKRQSLEKRMDGTLGWTGLGHCDGGSIGSGTFEVFCFVVDFEIAKQVVIADLKDTEFADYLRIYKNDNG
jgi:hypothetical protein